MSLLVVLLIALAAVAYVASPLLGGPRPGGRVLVAATPATFVAQGVAYQSEDEWAIDRALDKVEGDEPQVRVHRDQTELEREIERRVAEIRNEQRDARRRNKHTCPSCGRSFQPGESYCARCGAPHPRVCPQCGKRFRQGDAFCTACGSALAGGDEQ